MIYILPLLDAHIFTKTEVCIKSLSPMHLEYSIILVTVCELPALDLKGSNK